MLRFAIASLIAGTFVLATTFTSPSAAATHRKHVEKNHVELARDRVAQARYYGAPANYYGMPANYYPAPPFPFFLLPGPWWLPVHP